MELATLHLLLVLFSLLSLFFIFVLNPRSPTQNLPTTSTVVIRGYPIVGNLPNFIRNIHRILEWSTDLIASSPSGTVTLPPFIFTSNPQIVEHTSKSHFDNYIKPEQTTATIHDLLGHGILNVNGEQWRLQRKTASYEFNAKSLRAFVLDKLRYEIDARLLPLLTEASRTGRVLNLEDVLERFAFDNICSLVLDLDPDCLRKRTGEGEQFFRAFGEATEIVVKRGLKTFASIWRLKKLLNVGSERRLKESMTAVYEFIQKSVRSRRSSMQGNGDFLSRLAQDESHSDEFLRDIFINFVLAGRDTTPSALTWFFWNLSTRPDVVLKIQDELRLIRSRHNQAETFTNVDELREMNYLHAAISESLRLYPPVPLLLRKCLVDDLLPDGTPVKSGWMVMYNAYAMARTETIWGENCREFRPERWLEDGVFRPKNPFQFPVFHAGPRVCLGKDMAYIQMKAVAASVLERFEVEVVEDGGKQYELGITLKMKGGLPVKIKEQESGLSN